MNVVGRLCQREVPLLSGPRIVDHVTLLLWIEFVSAIQFVTNFSSHCRIGITKNNSVRTKRSAYAFRFGDRGGSLMGSMPQLAMMLRSSFVYSGSRSWIRYFLPQRNPSTASVRFRAICAIHSPSAELDMPPISTRRVDRSIKNRTVNRFRPVHVHTSMVKKSVAIILDQCRRRNSFHV